MQPNHIMPQPGVNPIQAYAPSAPPAPMYYAPPAYQTPTVQQPVAQAMPVGQTNQTKEATQPQKDYRDAFERLINVPHTKVKSSSPYSPSSIFNKTFSVLTSAKFWKILAATVVVAALTLGILSVCGVFASPLIPAVIGAAFVTAFTSQAFFLGYIAIGLILLGAVYKGISMAVQKNKTKNAIQDSTAYNLIKGQEDDILKQIARRGYRDKDYKLVQNFFANRHIANMQQAKDLKDILSEEVVVAIRKNKSVEWAKATLEKMRSEYTD